MIKLLNHVTQHFIVTGNVINWSMYTCVCVYIHTHTHTYALTN